MLLTRRSFLAATAAAAAAPGAQALTTAPARLHARPAEVRLAPGDHPATRLWTYDGTAPGPEIRVRRGEMLARRLVNGLDQPTTVHWHGIRLPNAMDGVPDLTQAPVAPGDEFDYAFRAPDAGTYWYHPHVRSWEQVARGLYGALIVEEDTPPAVDRELVLVLDDWRLDAGAQLDDSFGAMHDWSHAGRLGNFVTVNGDPALSLPAARHERLRLRLINVANARIFTIALQGLEGAVVALDGQPLAAPAPTEPLVLAPAQRADLIVDVTAAEGAEAFLVSIERDGGYALVTLPVRGQTRAAPPGSVPALPPNDLPALAEPAREARLVMAGGAMGRLASARVDGVETPIREMVGKGLAWAFNGSAGHSADPLVAAKLGETVAIDMVNDTRWPHAMHLHGHHFRALRADGPGPLRDTLLMQPGEAARIAFVADNPGKWMLHCHMLEHAAAGMTTWIAVE